MVEELPYLSEALIKQIKDTVRAELRRQRGGAADDLTTQGKVRNPYFRSCGLLRSDLDAAEEPLDPFDDLPKAKVDVHRAKPDGSLVSTGEETVVYNRHPTAAETGDYIEFLFRHGKWFADFGGSGGGGGDIIYFKIDSIDCVDGEDGDGYYKVEYKEYTGGCDIPPGIDPYTGLITVLPIDCPSPFTEDEIEAGAYGWAAYVAPKDDCEHFYWRVISMCAQNGCP